MAYEFEPPAAAEAEGLIDELEKHGYVIRRVRKGGPVEGG